MTHRLAWCVAIAAVSCCAVGTATAASGASMTGTVLARAQPVTRRYRAYAQVRPIAVTAMRAVEAGTVSRLVLPGERVRAGQVLAVLAGPQAEALLGERRGSLRAAALQLSADRRKLAARLVTRQVVAADEAAFDHARGQLRVALQTLTVRAPAAGQVLSVHAADGEQLASGQLILTLETGRPWLEARYYGTEALAIRPGVTGWFHPISGAAVPVRVKTVSRALGADGAEEVGLLPMIAPGGGAALAAAWRTGQWGTVTLEGATRSLVAVPSRALILDRAQWWVLVRTAHGDRRQRVVPGPSRGWQTFIEQGLEPGEHVVVQNAYLEFYHGIASRYTPPN